MSNYEEQWQEYRKRRNLLLFSFLAYVPVIGSIGFLMVKFLHTEVPVYILAFSWMAFYAISGFRFQLFRCPRCGKRFFLKWWNRNPFVRKCVHCGLPKFEGSGPHK